MGWGGVTALRVFFAVLRWYADGDKNVANNLRRFCRRSPQVGKLGPWQDSVGPAMWIVDLDFVAVEP